VYEPRPDPATVLRGEYRLRLHLPDLAALLGQPDRVDRIAVRSAPGVGADSLAALLNATAFGYRAHPSAAIASESSRTFLVVSRFHRAIGFIAIVASAIFLLCIMLLKVEERRLDAAVMRLMGLSRATVFRAFVLEAVLVAGAGSLAGIGLAWLAAAATNAVYQHRFATGLVFAWLTPGIVGLAVGLSLVLGVGAGALAAARLVRAQPLALWRRQA
jgi:putative ABC transport system permease protein